MSFRLGDKKNVSTESVFCIIFTVVVVWIGTLVKAYHHGWINGFDRAEKIWKQTCDEIVERIRNS